MKKLIFILKAKTVIICLAACIIVFFAGCKEEACKDGTEPWNLPALDWDKYYDIKTLLPYSHHYDNSNDSNFQDRQVKVAGWVVPNSGYEHLNTYNFRLSDDERVTSDYNFKPDITLKITGYSRDYSDVTKKMLQHLIDSVDITQKCYIVGLLACEVIEHYRPNAINCLEYLPVLVIYDINNISFGKEVENEK
ncbi:MAG: hypothetical protein LBN95_13890 [Prevotellaceae bacterium]|jgi:hypothetical protein|nr:hypothetical protein [Prevotellaceae bacterium]